MISINLPNIRPAGKDVTYDDPKYYRQLQIEFNLNRTEFQQGRKFKYKTTIEQSPNHQQKAPKRLRLSRMYVPCGISGLLLPPATSPNPSPSPQPPHSSWISSAFTREGCNGMGALLFDALSNTTLLKLQLQY